MKTILQIPVYMTEEETRLFIGFQRHRRLFETLDRENALGIPNSSVTVHFDKDGRVGSVDLKRTIR